MLRKLISKARDKLIDSVLYLVLRGPNPVTHKNVKAKLLKKVFWHINIERFHGEYFEFGVAFRNSMQSLVLASKFARAGFFGVGSQDGKFFGFDTFESFQSNDPGDEYETWVGDKFSFDLDTVSRGFARNPQVMQTRGDASRLGSESDFRDTVDSSVGGCKGRRHNA